MSYYDGTKLLSMQDINGKRPAIYISTSNRSAGKTTYYNSYILRQYVKTGAKFAILKRFVDDVPNTATNFFGALNVPAKISPGIARLYQGHEMEQTGKRGDAYNTLSYDGSECGYVLCLNRANKIKQASNQLSDVQTILFDEFIPETRQYVSDEINKFLSIITSIARGGGQQQRYIRIILISNYVTLLNPYYEALGISDKLKPEMKYMRGDGFVVEQVVNESAKAAVENNPAIRAFKGGSSYTDYLTGGQYLLDNSALISRLTGDSTYICTIDYSGRKYGLKLMKDGILYVDTSPDSTCKVVVHTNRESLRENEYLGRYFPDLIHDIKEHFDTGKIRFQTLMCREALNDLI